MYDIAEAFERIENELISSMMRNISKHIADEQREGIQYSQWQAEQIKALARYRQHNAAKYGTQFSDINAGLDTVIRQIYASARMSEEVKILEAVKHGLISAPSDFFTTDDNKLDMLIESVTNDFKKAEYAVLRRADDMYRQIIFNSQVYLNSGAGTLRQAIDMASKDFISAGINCIQYKDGRLVNISNYAEMALRTANQRAKFAAEGNERAAYGIHTVLISSHNGACPFCQKWQGRVYIDDVYSGGKPDGKYPLLSSAIAGGMFHPNCQNGLSTFIEGISSEPQPPTAETMKQQTELYNLQQQQRYNERQIRKYKRLSEYSLDDENRQKYSAKLKEWQKRQRNLIADNPDVLRRQYDRERNYGRVAYSSVSRSDEKVGKFFNNAKNKLTGNNYLNIIDKFSKNISNIENNTVRSLLKRAIKNVEFEKSQRQHSYFSGKENKVYLLNNIPPSTVAHELFHKIDKDNGITKGKMLDESIKKDYENLLKSAEKTGLSIEDMLYSKYPEAFEKKGRLKEEYRGVSDIINGMTKGKVKLGYKHDEDYWSKPQKLQKETFAQYGRFLYDNNPEVIQMINEIFPETTSSVNDILKAVELFGR